MVTGRFRMRDRFGATVFEKHLGWPPYPIPQGGITLCRCGKRGALRQAQGAERSRSEAGLFSCSAVNHIS
jgi:hypothetical protein